MRLVLYSKAGCHLCEGLAEKLQQVRSLPIELEVRDISLNSQWFAAYQFEVPVLCRVETDGRETPLPRLAPRASLSQVESLLQRFNDRA